MTPKSRTRAQIICATPTPTLPLPLELRTKILVELLTSQHAIHFYPKYMGKRPAKPILNNPMLAGRFSILCLVSKQMRWEAQKVFFEYNQWNLELSLVRTYPELENHDARQSHFMTRNGNRRHWGPSVTSTKMNTAEMIVEHWGEEALLRMRDVRIDVKGTDKELHVDTEAALKELMVLLKKGGKVRKLEVSWENRYGLGGRWCGTGRMEAGQEIRRASRMGDGAREEPAHRRIAGWKDKRWC